MKNPSDTPNPWLALPRQSPFVLPEDRPFLDVYSEATNPSDTAYRLHLPPLPFQGDLNAPIVLLGLNPGYAESDNQMQNTPYFIDANFRNYRHEPARQYPFFFLDPAIEGGVTGAGQAWWHRRLKPLREHYSDALLARAFLSVQYVPYRSRFYKHSKKRLPSQQYTFDLVGRAIERKSLIVALRSIRLWQEAVKELDGYPHLIELSNPRNPVLSPGQLGDDGWRALLAELNKLKRIPPRTLFGAHD